MRNTLTDYNLINNVLFVEMGRDEYRQWISRMNRNLTQPPALNGVVFSNLDALNNVLTEEFALLKVPKCVIVILDGFHNPTFHFHLGFTTEQLNFYVKHINQDMYLTQYLKLNMTGNFSYFPNLISDLEHQTKIYSSNLYQHLKIKHPFGGMYQLPNHHMLLFSAYCSRPPLEQQYQGLALVWNYIVSWANCWCGQVNLEADWEKLLTYKKRSDHLHHLTKAERQVLMLLLKGHDGKYIAEFRNVSKETVRSQIKQILRKTHCSSQIELLSAFFHGSLHIS